MRAAESTAKRYHRSTAEQIEYWAALGRSVASTLNPDVLLSVSSGLTKIKIEPVFNSPIDPEEVFHKLETDRQSGLLSNAVTTSVTCYQVSTNHPGYLEKITPDGTITTGRFENGQFIDMNGLGC